MAIFQIKNSDIFHISAQNIDCGYSLEPPRRGGSNEYPQSMFLSRNKKNNVYPCKPQFYYIKVGFKGVKIIYVCFRDVSESPCRSLELSTTKRSKADVVWRFSDIGTKQFQQVWITISFHCLPSSFSSVRHNAREEVFFVQFQDGRHGSHFGHWNWTTMSILDLHVTQKPLNKFLLDPT